MRFAVLLAGSLLTGTVYASRPLTPPAPEFPKGLAWLNSEELSLQRLRGRRVTLVAFLNVNSLNSIRTFPVLKAWWDRYSLDGLMVIGVHTPEFEVGRDPIYVRNALKRSGIRFPVTLDNDRKLWKAYQNEGWPVFYLVDHRGLIVHDHLGEGSYREFEREILKALKQLNGFKPPESQKLVPDPKTADCGLATAMVPVGLQKGGQKSLEGVRELRHILSSLRDGEVSYKGRWIVEPQALRNDRDNPGFTDFIRLIYRGAESAAILGTATGRPTKVYVKQNDLWLHSKNAGQDVQWDEDDRSYVAVSEPRIYYLSKNTDDNMQEIYLYPADAGVKVSGFDFSNACQLKYELK
ncbi:MAG: hypothetical protein HY078_11895 [Elusimicrobia bacterium]|nr:hypothetical protein [Elusimicrobiota bacterium]